MARRPTKEEQAQIKRRLKTANRFYDRHELHKAIETTDRILAFINNYDETFLRDELYEALRLRATSNYEMQNYIEVIEDYKKCQKFRDDDATVWNNLGDAYRKLSEYKKASNCFKRALASSSEKTGETISIFWNNLGNATSDLGQVEEAIQYYSNAIDANPKNPSPWNNRAIAKSKLNFKKKQLKILNNH